MCRFCSIRTRQLAVYSDRLLVADTGPNAFEPKMTVYRSGQKEKIDELIRRIAAEQAALDARANMMTDQRRQWEQRSASESSWKFQIPQE